MTQINPNLEKVIERMKLLQVGTFSEGPAVEPENVPEGANYGEGFDANALRDKMQGIALDTFNRMPEAKTEQKPERPSFFKRLGNAIVAFFKELFGINNSSDVKTDSVNEPEPESNPEESPVGGEKFEEVFAEMQEKVPDSTTTIEEKELAIEYINRMLACEDIPNAEYWQNKKDTITMEIQTIKNESQIGQDSDWQAVVEEWRQFTDEYWNKEPKFESDADRVEYYTISK